MATVPMKQSIIVERMPDEESLDIWGNPTQTATEVTHKCRIDEGSYVTTDVTKGDTGDRAVSTAKILLDKLVDIGYADYIRYTNELGETIRRKPLKINVMRGFNGKPLLTEVLI